MLWIMALVHRYLVRGVPGGGCCQAVPSPAAPAALIASPTCIISGAPCPMQRAVRDHVWPAVLRKRSGRDPSTPLEVPIICNGNRGTFNVETQLMVSRCPSLPTCLPLFD